MLKRPDVLVTALNILPFLIFIVVPSTLYTVAITLMTYIVLAQSLNIIFGYTGYLPFGHMAFFGIGAYTMAILTLGGFTPILSVIMGGLAAVGLALLFAPLLRLKGIYFAVATLAAGLLIYYLVINLPREITGGPYGLNIIRSYNPTAAYLLMVMLLLVTMLMVNFIARSHIGLALTAIRDNSMAASMVGVNPLKFKIFAWIISSVIAGLAGAIYAWYISWFLPETVFNVSLTTSTIIYAVFGGVGTILGPAIGTIILFLLYNFVGYQFVWSFSLIYGILLILIVLFLPKGIMGFLHRYFPKTRFLR